MGNRVCGKWTSFVQGFVSALLCGFLVSRVSHNSDFLKPEYCTEIGIFAGIVAIGFFVRSAALEICESIEES
jgi:hypothetical protein